MKVYVIQKIRKSTCQIVRVIDLVFSDQKKAHEYVDKLNEELTDSHFEWIAVSKKLV